MYYSRLISLVPPVVSLIGVLIVVVLFIPSRVIADDVIAEDVYDEKRTNRESRSIVNGTPVSSNVWPAVVRLAIQKTLPTNSTNVSNWTCTGTFLARDTIKTARDLGTLRGDVILTAAHCFNPDGEGRVVTRVTYWRDGSTQGQTTTAPQSWPRNPQYTEGTGQHDTALVFFANRNGFTNGLPVCEQAPSVGDQITLVGFGCNDYPSFNTALCTGDRIKRQGANTIDTVGGTIEFVGPARNGSGVEQNSAQGDSGSPYIVTRQGHPCVSGVVSGGLLNDTNSNGLVDNTDTKSSVGANLHNASSQAFLTAQLPGFDCDIYENNCSTRYANLYREFYGQQPDAAAVSQNTTDLINNQNTLHEIATDFRSDLFLKAQPALTMLLDLQ